MPAQHASSNNHFALGKKPIARRRVAVQRRSPGDARHLPMPVVGLPNVQLQTIHDQLVQLEQHGGTQAQGHHHFGQGQCWPLLRVQQFDVAQLKRGDPAGALCRQSANAHGYTQRLPGKALQCGAKFVDSRHNPKMQACPSQTQHQPGDQQTPQKKPDQPGQPALQTRFGQGQGGRMWHKRTN